MIGHEAGHVLPFTLSAGSNNRLYRGNATARRHFRQLARIINHSPGLGELVYRLCIAECAGLDRYRAEVTKLESSTAAGNRYIRVRLPVDVSTSNFIPNHQTLICVSAKYIPLSRLKEHCIQRESLDTFSTKHGAAYILASTRQGMQNLSAAAYRDQMRASVTNQVASTSHLAVDAHFYSRETLEAWLREQPTVASWLGQRFAALERQLSPEKSARSDNVIYSTRLQRSP